MKPEEVVFLLLILVALGAALFVAVSKNLVRSVFMFFVALFAVAGLYVFALADFVAVTQIVLYVGGVLVLMMFTFMLSSKETLQALEDSESRLFSIKNLPAMLVSALFFIVLVNTFFKADVTRLQWIAEAGDNTFQPQNNTIENIGINLMTSYLLPFEAVSILLLMALVGAAHISRKEVRS